MNFPCEVVVQIDSRRKQVRAILESDETEACLVRFVAGHDEAHAEQKMRHSE